jgi:excisionase family DNA binding protein
MQKIYVGTKELCELFSLSRSTLELLIKNGLPVVRIGKSRRYRIEDVDQWLKLGGKYVPETETDTK